MMPTTHLLIVMLALTSLVTCSHHLINSAGKETLLEKLDILVRVQKLLQRAISDEGDDNTYISTTYKGQEVTERRSKKGSVSWLLAAAIRMCKKYPKNCLRQRQEQGGAMDLTG